MGKKFSLKSLFIQENDVPNNAKEVEKKNEIREKTAPRTTKPDDSTAQEPLPIRSPHQTSIPTGTEDPLIRDSLIQALEESNQAGYDYFEFAKSVEQQKSIIESEQVRFQASYAAAAVMGVSQPLLLESAQYYIKVLQAKEKEFNDALQQNYAHEIQQRENEQKSIEAQIQKKSELIVALTKEISQLQTKQTELTDTIQKNKQKIETIKINFYQVYTRFVNKISSDVDKIKQYLPR